MLLKAQTHTHTSYTIISVCTVNIYPTNLITPTTSIILTNSTTLTIPTTPTTSTTPINPTTPITAMETGHSIVLLPDHASDRIPLPHEPILLVFLLHTIRTKLADFTIYIYPSTSNNWETNSLNRVSCMF